MTAKSLLGLAMCILIANDVEAQALPKLKRYAATELDFLTTAGIIYQIQSASGKSAWTNFDLPIFGDGSEWSKAYLTRGSKNRYQITTVSISNSIALYPLNGNVLDFSGQANNGTAIGVTGASDRFGNTNSAFLFAGDGSTYISIPDSASLNVTNALTVSAWVKTKGGGYAEPRILTKGSYQLGFSDTSSSPQVFFTLEPNGSIASSPISLCDGDWLFVAGTYDGQTMKLYTNGVLATQTSASGSIGINHEPLGIGENLDDFSDYFHGSIDDVQIYDRALNATEIQQLFEAPY